MMGRTIATKPARRVSNQPCTISQPCQTCRTLTADYMGYTGKNELTSRMWAIKNNHFSRTGVENKI